MTIALTIALAAIVTFSGVALVAQYHRTASDDRRAHRRLMAIQSIDWVGEAQKMTERCQRPHDCAGDCSYPDCQSDA